MKIVSVDVIPITLRLKGTHSNALAKYDSTDDVYVCIRTDSGESGYGATAPKFYITGETSKTVVPVLVNTLIPSILGLDPFAVGTIHQRMDSAIVGNTSAKTAIDIALYDLMGKALGVPACDLLGGRVRGEIDAFELVPMGDAARTVESVSQFASQGIKEIKLKVGTDRSSDLERVEAVARAFPDLHLKADANQSWRPKEAIRMCDRLAELGVDMVEQPVHRRDVSGLGQVTTASRIDIVGDEAVAGPSEVLQLAAARAVDVFNIKLVKAGGLFRAKQMAAIAEAAQMKCMAGATVQNILLDAATAHFMASTSNVNWHEIKGPSWIVDDVAEGLNISDGRIAIPQASGLGVAIDEERLDGLKLKT